MNDLFSSAGILLVIVSIFAVPVCVLGALISALRGRWREAGMQVGIGVAGFLVFWFTCNAALGGSY